MRIEFDNRSDSACDERSLKSVVQFAARHLKLHDDCVLSLSIVDLEEMAELHMQWMDEPGPTDVLSFPMDEIALGESDPGILGDVVLCPRYAEAGAAKAGSSLHEELELLTVHGLLHLLGLDHREQAEREAMFALQGEILREWRSRS